MAPPRIGITTYGRGADNWFRLPAEYVDSVRRAGGMPMLIAPGEEHLDAWLDLLDGVVLTGGGDLDARHYGGTGHELTYLVDEERDATELALARRLCERDVPTLAVCRGLQVVNVAFGGTLIEHLPDEVGERVLHRAPPREPIPHPVQIDPDSRLAALLGATDIQGASWHHQAVRALAPGFRVAARAPDGTIEAIEHPAHPHLIAVQWHPELTSAQDPTQQRLFDTLIWYRDQYRRESGRCS